MSVSIPAHDGRPVGLRRASPSDVEIVYEWRCHPETRRFARNPQPLELDDHKKWFAERLASDDCVLCMILYNGEPAGMLRFDRQIDDGPDTWEVSILVAPDKKGRGIASAALALGRQVLPSAEFIAEVLAGNDTSHQLFRKAGYVLGGDGVYHSIPDQR